MRHNRSKPVGVAADRVQTQQCSDGDGEGGGVSDSHPDTVTDPELSDPPIVTTSSPPQSGDEVKNSGKEKSVGRSLFPREIRLMRGRGGGGGGVTSTPDRSRTVSASVASNVAGLAPNSIFFCFLSVENH